MEQTDFVFNKKYSNYLANVNGFEIEIDKNDFNSETVLLAEKILAAYPQKIAEIAHFIAKDMEAEEFFAVDEKDMSGKLHLPDFLIEKSGGSMTYCNHELDNEHIIYIEFDGVLDKFLCGTIDG